MAKTSISAGDLSILRGNSATKNIRIHTTPLTVVQTGSITDVPAKDPYVQVTWDGTTTGIVEGQLVKIVNGTTLRTWGIIRKAPSGSTLYINEVPLGSPGYTTDIESAVQVGDTVNVYSHHPMWGLHSRINKRTFYLAWDLAYTDQNENIPPVANAGQWQSAKITSGTASFTLPRFGSNTSFAMAGTLSSYLWTLPSGVTLKSGYATSDDVIEVDAEPGQYLVSLKVTDSNAKTHTAYVWLFVSNGTTGQSLDEQYPVSELSISRTRKGWTGAFTITGTDLEDVLYPGAGILINEDAYYENGTLSDNVLVDCHIGYVVGLDYSYNSERIPTATVTIESPLVYADKIVQPEQSLTEASSPATWNECTSGMSNPRGGFYYAAKYKTSALLDMHDFDANSLTAPRRKTIEYNTQTLGAAIETISKLFNVAIGSAADGTSVMRDKPQYMNNTDRNSLDVRMTWQAQDFALGGELVYTYNLLSRIAETTGGAFAYNGTKTKAWLAGKKWNQGNGKTTMPNFTVAYSDGVDRVLEVVGHYHAEQNRDINEIPLTLLGNMDVIDLPYMIWDRLTIASTYDPRGKGWSNARMLATRVDCTWNKDTTGIAKTITIGLQPETFGQPAKEIPISSYKAQSSKREPIEFQPLVDDGFGSLGAMLVCNETGDFAVTYNYLSASPQWNNLTTKFTGDICDFDWNYNSDYFANGNDINSALGVYVCTIDGTTFRVYELPDVLDPSSIPTELTSETMNDGSANYNGRIKCSKATPTLVLAAWKDQTGTEFIRSTDGGTTWSSKANVGSTVTDTDNDDAHIGLDVDDTYQIITAPDATPEYGLYLATTAGGAFSALTNSERSTAPLPMAKIETGTDTAYAALAGVEGAGASNTVTFDTGGANYTLTVDNDGSITSNGNPDNCLSVTVSTDIIEFEVDFGKSVTCDDVFFDVYSSDYDETSWKLYIDEVLKTTQSSSGTADTWRSLDFDNFGSLFPLSGQVWRVRFTPTDTTADDVRVDNIFFDSTDEIPGTGSDAVTYKITDIDGTDSWTDISPTTDRAPERPHDFAIDVIDSTVLNMVTDTNKVWYQSTDSGSNWTSKEASSSKRVPYSVGDAIAFGGASEVVVGLDSTNFDDATGNLSASWTIGTIKKLLIL